MRSTDDSALRTVQFDESSTRSSFFIEKKLKTRLHAVSDTQSHTLLNPCLAYKTFVNSHVTSGEKCVEIIKTLHVKFFPFGARAPARNVTVKS